MGQGMPSALQQPSQRVIENQTTSIFSINTISHYHPFSSKMSVFQRSKMSLSHSVRCEPHAVGRVIVEGMHRLHGLALPEPALERHCRSHGRMSGGNWRNTGPVPPRQCIAPQTPDDLYL